MKMKVALHSSKLQKENNAYLRGLAVGLSMKMLKVTEIAKMLKVDRRTIQRWKKKHQEQEFCDKRTTGRRRKTTHRSDRLLTRLARKHNFSSAKELRNMWKERVSLQTVYRRLRIVGLRKRASFCAPLLSINQKKSRERWAMKKCAWRQAWRNVIFSDESRFRRMNNDRRVRVWREMGQRMAERNCKASVQAMGGSIHVWGAIWFGGRSKLTILKSFVNGKTYTDLLKRFFDDEETPSNHLFQDDNAPAHRSVQVERFCSSHSIRRLDWPSRSPDLNPIEHLWDLMKRRISKRGHIDSLKSLEEAIVEEWNAIPESIINSLIDSMQRRVRAVITAKGSHTRY